MNEQSIKNKKENKKDVKICLECSEEIDLTFEKYVQLSTINNITAPDEHAYFHFPCYVDYFNKRVENKMRVQVQRMQEQAVKLFEHPIIKESLSKIRGSDMALNMLKLPLNKVTVTTKERVEKKIKEKDNDDKRKRDRNKKV
jgi:hypothetical protein